jgi:hypothetical protein
MPVALQSFEKALVFLSDKLKMIGAASFSAWRFSPAPTSSAGCSSIRSSVPSNWSVSWGYLTVAMALPITQLTKGHIGVELFVDKLPRKGAAVHRTVHRVCQSRPLYHHYLAHVPVQHQAQGLGGGVDEPPLAGVRHSLCPGHHLFVLCSDLVLSIVTTFNKLVKS